MSSRSNLPPKPKLKPKPGAVIVVRAHSKYIARYPDELSFEEGDILYVFDRTNPDWWKARFKSNSGLVPSNYVEASTDEVVNPLHEAARRGNVSFLQECLSQGVSSTGLDSMGNTPLYWASHSGHVQCLRVLLDQPNPPINAQNHFGDTPLHAATVKNHYEAVDLLLSAGANPSVKNNNGETVDMLVMNTKLKNLLQKYKYNESYFKNVTVSPEEYNGESD